MFISCACTECTAQLAVWLKRQHTHRCCQHTSNYGGEGSDEITTSLVFVFVLSPLSHSYWTCLGHGINLLLAGGTVILWIIFVYPLHELRLWVSTVVWTKSVHNCNGRVVSYHTKWCTVITVSLSCKMKVRLLQFLIFGLFYNTLDRLFD